MRESIRGTRTGKPVASTIQSGPPHPHRGPYRFWWRPGFTVVRGEGDLSVVCNKGDLVGSALIKEEVAGMVWGNILLGGLIGLAVDAGTGKMWKYSPVANVVLYEKDKQPKDPQIIESPSPKEDSAEKK